MPCISSPPPLQDVLTTLFISDQARNMIVTGKIEDESKVQLEPGKHFFQLSAEFDCTQPGAADQLVVVLEVKGRKGGGGLSTRTVFSPKLALAFLDAAHDLEMDDRVRRWG